MPTYGREENKLREIDKELSAESAIWRKYFG
jgi:hypothetical protein